MEEELIRTDVLCVGGGIAGLMAANEKAETSLRGLYAAGDEAFGDISAAATFGYIAGENAAAYSQWRPY